MQMMSFHHLKRFSSNSADQKIKLLKSLNQSIMQAHVSFYISSSSYYETAIVAVKIETCFVCFPSVIHLTFLYNSNLKLTVDCK